VWPLVVEVPARALVHEVRVVEALGVLLGKLLGVGEELGVDHFRDSIRAATDVTP